MLSLSEMFDNSSYHPGSCGCSLILKAEYERLLNLPPHDLCEVLKERNVCGALFDQKAIYVPCSLEEVLSERNAEIPSLKKEMVLAGILAFTFRDDPERQVALTKAHCDGGLDAIVFVNGKYEQGYDSSGYDDNRSAGENLLKALIANDKTATRIVDKCAVYSAGTYIKKRSLTQLLRALSREFSMSRIVNSRQ